MQGLLIAIGMDLGYYVEMVVWTGIISTGVMLLIAIGSGLEPCYVGSVAQLVVTRGKARNLGILMAQLLRVSSSPNTSGGPVAA